MNLAMVRRIALLIVLAVLIYRNGPILQNMLGSNHKKSIEVFEVPGPIIGSDCPDEKSVLARVVESGTAEFTQIVAIGSNINFLLDISKTGNLVIVPPRITNIITDCVRNDSGSCSDKESYLIYLGECSAKKPVTVKAWGWSKSFDKVIVVKNSADRLMVDVLKDNKKVASLELVVNDPKNSDIIVKLKPNYSVNAKNFFRKDYPYNVYINDIEMKILSLNLNRI